MLKKIFIYLVALFFHLFPRNKRIWLTGKPTPWYDGKDCPCFFDNSKYLFLYLHYQTKSKVYWVTSSNYEISLFKELNLPFIKYKTFKYYYFTLRAKYFFHHYGTNQISEYLQLGSTQINLWHGTPLKKIRYDVFPKEEEKHNFIYNFLNKKGIEYVCSTSNYLSTNFLSHAFDVELDNFLNFGYPRNDIFSLSQTDLYHFISIFSKDLIPIIDILPNYEKVILYMPTWRDYNPNFFRDNRIDYESLNNKLHELNYLFLLKLHPLANEIENVSYSNIYQLGNDIDIYPLLKFTNFLVTDYSSIYFDYLLLDKEIIFIPCDFDEYIKERQLYFDYDKITPGKKYSSFSDFIKDLHNIDKLNYSKERINVKNKLIDKNYSFDASKNIFDFFCRID